MFKEFAKENLNSLPHPTNKNKSVDFNDISILCDLLFCVINQEVEELSLKRIKSNFENDFEKIYNLDRKELASSIEGLATNFESFLKKIGLIKFGDGTLWNGDGIYKGIKKCMLYELIEGKASKIDSKSNIEDFKEFPSPLVINSGTSKAILDFVRIELRNAVHSANPYTRAQLIQYSNLVLGSYLIAINDNLTFFKKMFFQEFAYLENIVSNREFNKLNKYYIDLYGKEENFDFENIAIEQLDGQKLIESISFIENENELEEKEETEDSEKEVARIDSVVNISRDTNRFIIIGEPGSGKTTSLQKILYENAVDVLNGKTQCRLPIYIKASSYSLNKSFNYLILNEVSFTELDDLKLKHKVLILIDGLNEIEDEFKRLAINELKELINKYTTIDFIITSRKFGFINQLNLNVYELKKLNENQIKQLLINVLENEKGNNLWIQVKQNKQILELASNPLLLMMIIKVSSLKNNEIPANKGLLYKLFNDAILAREQKFYKTATDTKKDILSYIAFWMRNNGIFKKIKKVQAKELIREKLLEIDHSLGVNEILNELSDNNIFIEKNEELEFYHETQAEYFVALELQNIFFKNKGFNFDYSDNKWFEPILICSDLFTNEEDILDFFEIVFVGEKKSHLKYLNQLDSTDVNHKFYIACKVAYNLQNTHPSLFRKAETFLSNYLIIWHYRNSENVRITDFENLIKAVASLSSEQLFRKFFFNLKNLECWFYSKEFDDRIENFEAFQLFEEKFNTYIKSFSENLNDFTLLYKVMKDGEKSFNHIHSLSRSVYNNIKIFSRYLLRNSPTSQLIHAFKETNSLEILFEIGKSDIEFFIENYHSKESDFDIEFYTFICKFHLRNIFGIQYLIKSLKDEKIKPDIRLYILSKLLGDNEYLEIVFDSLRELVVRKDVLMFFEDAKEILNRYSIKTLGLYGIDVIYTNPTIIKSDLKLNFILEKNDQLVFECHNNNIDSDDILNNMSRISHNEKFIDFQQCSIDDKFWKTSKIIVVKGSPELINQCFEKYYLGSSFTIHYRDFKGQSNPVVFHFKELYRSKYLNQLFIEVNSNTNGLIKHKFKRFQNIKLLIGQEFRFSIDGFIDYSTSIYLACKRDSVVISAKDTIFQIYKIDINLDKPFNYHRDIIKSNYAFVRYLGSQISKPEVINFVKSIGLSHLFAKELNDLNLGLVTYKYDKNSFNIVRLNNYNQINSNSIIKSIPDEEIGVNNIVLIENNLNISKVENSLIREKFSIEGEILNTNPDNSEGFISGESGVRDYYFLAQHCAFAPCAGLIVEFIPGLNFSKNNSSRPMAYCISLVPLKNKIARVTKIVKHVGHLDVSFLDINTEQKLFSRILETQKISNFKGLIEIGDIFSYYIPSHFKEILITQRIHLTGKLNISSNNQ